MRKRRFGRSDVHLSPLSFGSMRLSPEVLDEKQVVHLLEYLYERGVTSYHSSSEYDFFPFFTRCLQEFRRRNPGAEVQHIVKLAAPHFDEPGFSTSAFEARLDAYLDQLGAERIDVVQWLIRQTPNSLDAQLEVLDACAEEVAELHSTLVRKGKVGALACFPYYPEFADRVAGEPFCDGLAAYLNLAEVQYAHLVDHGFIAIRPLFAGLLTPHGLERTHEDVRREVSRQHIIARLSELGVASEESTSFALRFCLQHEQVATAVVSVSSTDHAAELIEVANATVADTSSFERIADLFGAPLTAET